MRKMIFIIIIFCLVFVFLSKNKKKNLNLDKNDLEKELFESFTDGNVVEENAGEKALKEENKVEMRNIKSKMKNLSVLDKAALASAKKDIDSNPNMSAQQKRAVMINTVKNIATRAEQTKELGETMKKLI